MGVTEAHAFVASLVHIFCTLGVGDGWARRSRLSYNVKGKQEESDRAGDSLFHDYTS